ncbi:hypothetical protein MKX01_011006 [Papaver californicum]|nr:hypothetical protein MKX01_011006 [Papaver californicum]
MEDHPLNCLPQEIIYNIFSRLPVESVLDSKLVCKPLRNILHFLCLIQKGLFYCVVYNDEHIKSIRWMNLKFPVNVFGIVGSCNGLICFSVETEKYKDVYIHHSRFSTHYISCKLHHPNEPFYICNPITREYVSLPELRTDDDKNGSSSSAYIVHGFGYHPLTNEHKVIRILYPVHESDDQLPYKGHCEVYTIGSGSGWRSAGEIYHYIHCFSAYAKSVCVDGSFYWLCEGSRDILAFDLASEIFYWLLPPPETTTTGSYKLCVMSGCLCLIHEYPVTYAEYGVMFSVSDLWFCTKVNESETTSSSSTYHTSKVNYDKSSNCFQRVFLPELLVVPTSHINSFVSLRALGEKNVKIFTECPAAAAS